VTAKNQSEAARDLSQQWANEDEDTEVAGGEYSAKHYSKKSAASATAATQQASAAQSAADQSLAQMSANIMQYLTSLTYSGLELQSAQIAWPDGATGTLTVNTWNSTWAAIDVYSHL